MTLVTFGSAASYFPYSGKIALGLFGQCSGQASFMVSVDVKHHVYTYCKPASQPVLPSGKALGW